MCSTEVEVIQRSGADRRKKEEEDVNSDRVNGGIIEEINKG